MKKNRIDSKSLLIGFLAGALLFTLLGAGNQSFNSREISRLKKIAAYIRDDGNLNLGKKKIIMQGSSIYDDGSDGGGLIIKGGANKVHVHGSQIIYDNPVFKRDSLNLNTNLNMGKKKIIMQGSSIYDDSSDGGGLIVKGGANKIHVHGSQIMYNNPVFKRGVLDLNANLNMGKKKIIMQGSSIFDDSSEGGGLIVKGGANKIHMHGSQVMYNNPVFKRGVLDLNANLNMGKKKIIMQGSSLYDDGSQGGGLIVKGGANKIHFIGKTVQH